MDKKELLLQMLIKLKGYWQYAQKFIDLLNQGKLNDKVIDLILGQIKNSIKLTKDQGLREKLEKSLSFMEKIKQKELIERQQEESELEDMLSQI